MHIDNRYRYANLHTNVHIQICKHMHMCKYIYNFFNIVGYQIITIGLLWIETHLPHENLEERKMVHSFSNKISSWRFLALTKLFTWIISVNFSFSPLSLHSNLHPKLMAANNTHLLPRSFRGEEAKCSLPGSSDCGCLDRWLPRPGQGQGQWGKQAVTRMDSRGLWMSPVRNLKQ